MSRAQYLGEASNRNDDFERVVKEVRILLDKARILIHTESDLDGEEEPDDERCAIMDYDGVSSAIYSLKVYVDCLMDLLPSMENMLSLIGENDLGDKAASPIAFQVSDPARSYVIRVYDKFKRANTRLIERLGEANWQRHISLRTHHTQNVKVPQETLDKAPKSIFVPVSLFHDSGLGSTLPAYSSYAATVASHSSFVSSVEDSEIGELRVPATPKEVFDGVPFECTICGHTLRKIKSRIDWK